MKPFLTAITMLLFASCQVLAPRKTNETLARGVYATADAMDAGRFDEADRYAHETTKLVPPPKKRIKISPISK